jgi:hypothetical protein
MSTTLLSLPIDVLLTIRDVISIAPFTTTDPALGLLAHLSFSQTCRGLRDLYTFSNGEWEISFWKRACLLAGCGRPMRREYPQALPGSAPHNPPPSEVLTWKQIAHLVTSHKRTCEIRSCRNASCWPGMYFIFTSVVRFPPRWPYLGFSLPASILFPIAKCHATHFRSRGNIHPDDVPRQPISLAFHPLFYYLHFSAGAEFDPTNALHTLLPTHPDCLRKLYAPLCRHASAACAFVTSPPVHAITILHPDSECAIASVRNPDGCTLLDVNRLLGDLCVNLPPTRELLTNDPWT